MKCQKCNSEKIQIISESIQTNEKCGQGFFNFLYILCVLGLLLAFKFFVDGTQKSKEIPLLSIEEIALALNILKFIIFLFFITMLSKRLAPFIYETRTKVVCLDCGNYWYLEDLNNNLFEHSYNDFTKR